MIITKYVQFRLPNGQFCLNICSAFYFLSAYSRIINAASLPGSSRPTCIQNDGLTHTAAQSQTGTAGDIAREKASTAWVGVELRKHLDTVDAWVGSEANDRGVAL